ncbi:MAG: tRNA (N6-isopentenyl adenosine(37)-C2)-methylthiotransferase MiaB [Flavobacteriales bacterium]|nr:tRNA (N6-isopentenyl adenosine(37)-C2)-methylthiotransferase MiaB [Flavobacteriales bacterium]
MRDSDQMLDEARQGEAIRLNGAENGKKLYLESYGCQMNFSDSEIVASILQKEGFTTTQEADKADVILLNTCAIRENAEQRVRGRIQQFNQIKAKNPGTVIGVLGCMAERLKAKLLEEEKLVDLVVGPDAYRDLPNLVEQADEGHKAVNVLLSREETYADLNPIRLNSNGVTAYISIMRGCDNMCSFCVVPFTRGRERSRDPESIVHEAQYLFDQGYREVTLLGQNVDSYRWNLTRKDEKKDPDKESVNFAQLLKKVADVNPDLRVRFSTSHPKDMTDEVLHTMAAHENICNYIHLPVQSGSTAVLENMNRGYSREWYLERIDAIRRIIPHCGISTDIMTGFCGESEQDHQDTLDLMEQVRFDFSYMFAYSERPKTLAQRKLEDDILEKVKKSRLQQVIDLQSKHSMAANKAMLGKVHKVLIEGTSKRSNEELFGRTTQNVVMVFPKQDKKKGDYVHVLAEECTAATLRGTIVEPAD